MMTPLPTLTEIIMSQLKVGDRVWVSATEWSDCSQIGYATVVRLLPDGFAEVQFEPTLLTVDRLRAVPDRRTPAQT